MKTRHSAFVAALVVALLAGCASKEPQPTAKPAPAPTPAPAPEVAKPAPAPAAPTETYSKLAGRTIKPNVAKPMNIKADCTYRDPTGYGGKLKLVVSNSAVSALQADIQVPKRGNCAWALKDFHQTAKEPTLTLSSSGACSIRLWEQEDKITVAFSNCKDRCQGDSFDYVWPIIVNTKTGKCS
jgi:hypothetical protein